MPRLIDANEILKSEHQHYDYMADEYYVLVRDIEDTPTVDAVPVVRCKDCFYSWPFDEEELKEPYRVGEWHCEFWYGEMHGDDYCSCGKRRPDETPTQKSVDNALEALDEVG